MSAVKRIGVAGAGLIGRKHIELIEASPNCVVAGIADPSAGAKAFAATNYFPGIRTSANCLSENSLTARSSRLPTQFI